MENAITDMAAASILTATTPYMACEIIELPVFKPNEYFFQHHQKPGEQKWETFRRVMREIMAEHGGYKLTNITIEDKFKYRSIIYSEPKSKTQNDAAKM